MHSKMIVKTLLALWCAGTMLAAPVLAGQACEDIAPSTEQTVLATRMAERTISTLDALPDRVVLIGRVGQDLSKYGLTYSHMAFAVREEGGWSLIHLLNACGTATSALYEQGMVDFFSDSPFKYQAGIWRLRSDMQERLMSALHGKAAMRLHDAHYNMLMYPLSTKYQNSNAWVLEVLSYAMAPRDEVATRAEAQDWLRRTGYVPTQLEIGAMTRLGARISKANIAFDDHPPELRWNGKIQTVTVASIPAYLAKQGVCGAPGCPEISVVLE
jgi:hypothetical protein